LTKSADQAELSPVVGKHGIQVLKPRLRQGLDRLEYFDRTRRARQAGAAADAREVQLKRLDPLSHCLTGLVHLARGRSTGLIRRHHVGGNLGLDPDHIDVGRPALGLAAVHDGAVGEAKIP
jgi:hypothetical protein